MRDNENDTKSDTKNNESATSIISYSGLDDAYYVSVKREQSSTRRRAKNVMVAIPTEKLRPDSDNELAALLSEADCTIQANDRHALQ